MYAIISDRNNQATVRVGDEILQSATTSDMLWSVARTIATISEYSTLEPGEGPPHIRLDRAAQFLIGDRL